MTTVISKEAKVCDSLIHLRKAWTAAQAVDANVKKLQTSTKAALLVDSGQKALVKSLKTTGYTKCISDHNVVVTNIAKHENFVEDQTYKLMTGQINSIGAYTPVTSIKAPKPLNVTMVDVISSRTGIDKKIVSKLLKFIKNPGKELDKLVDKAGGAVLCAIFPSLSSADAKSIIKIVRGIVITVGVVALVVGTGGGGLLASVPAFAGACSAGVLTTGTLFGIGLGLAAQSGGVTGGILSAAKDIGEGIGELVERRIVPSKENIKNGTYSPVLSESFSNIESGLKSVSKVGEGVKSVVKWIDKGLSVVGKLDKAQGVVYGLSG